MSISKAIIFCGMHAKQLGPADRGAQKFELDDAAETDLAGGTGNNQVDLLFSDKRTLASNTSENLDLAGALADAFGATITFAKIKAICVKNPATNSTSITVGGAASNTFTGPFADATDKITIPPGGMALLAAPASGWVVTPSTGDILKVANSTGASADYSIDILGTSV